MVFMIGIAAVTFIICCRFLVNVAALNLLAARGEMPQCCIVLQHGHGVL